MQTIKDILDEHRVPTAGADHKHGRVGWVQVDCPWCGSVGKFHLGISLSTGAASCWVCGKKNTASTLARLTGKSPVDMRERIDSASLVAAPVRPTGRLVVPVGTQAMLPAHQTYLRRRGMDAAAVAATWGVQGIRRARLPREDEDDLILKWRLFIPIHYHGEVVSWTTRTIRPKERQRYVSAGMEQEAIPHKSILYGADYAYHAIIIHEGPLDVWATGPGAVATCGTGFTEAQLLAMSKYAVRAVCFDSHPLAQRRARELADMLSGYPGTTHNVELETGDDPADVLENGDPDEIAELRAAFLE